MPEPVQRYPFVCGYGRGKIVQVEPGQLLAGRGLISTFANPAGLSHLAGMVVLGGWAVLGLAAAALVYRFRDT